MSYLYNIIIHIFHFSIQLFSLFNPKAKLWVQGRKGIFGRIAREVKHDKPLAWFHCASLGEFEQGRPVIEAFKKQFPDFRIMLTFFSPSGFEVRKSYEQADYIYYLPIDTLSNAKRFLNLTNPKVAFFIKYEYWFNYILQLKKLDIPVIGVASIFRPGQRFFRKYGRWQRNALRSFKHFFVQNELSKKLLNDVGIHAVTLSGDTQFNHVFEVAAQKKEFPLVRDFKNEFPLIIAGSTWPADEALLIEMINQNRENLKFIIASHEVHPERIDNLMKKLPENSLRFSELNAANAASARVLLIDNIGILLHLYQYSDIAYIGGGFGVGIHNILEAATFGRPVIFGPNYKKFQEACELVARGGAFPVNTKAEFVSVCDKLLGDAMYLKTTSDICLNYVHENQGATQMIISYLKEKKFGIRLSTSSKTKL